MSIVPPSRAPVARTCLHCGRDFTAPLNAVKRGKGKYCSPACGHHAPKPNRDFGGANNPNWRGGISQDKYHYKLIQIERYPDRVSARNQVNAAVLSGWLEPQPCADCGNPDKPQAHHEDYSRPLDVVWLCRSCHRAKHGGRH